MFVAPVSGTYIFFATVFPMDSSDYMYADVNSVLEGKRVGYAYCNRGVGSATDHCVTKITAGQRVWLRTDSGKSSFLACLANCFTGALLMPNIVV